MGKRSIWNAGPSRRHVRAASTIASGVMCGLGLSGCAVPYLDTAQAAYRVDPVLVQWHARNRTPGQASRDYASCPRPPHARVSDDIVGERNTRDAVDVLCPLDLDTYVFPQNLPGTELAYTQLLKCQQQVAPMEYQASLALEIQALGTRLATLKQEELAFPARISNEKALQANQLTLSKDFKAKAEAALAEVKKLEASAPTDEAKLNAAKVKAADAQKEEDKANKAAQVHGEKAAQLASDLEQVKSDITTTDIIVRNHNALSTQLGAEKPGTAPVPTPAGAQLEAVCITLRNQLQDELINRSNMMCGKHLADVKATAAVYNSTFGFASLAQSSLAAIVTGQTWARLLAAGASVTTGSQAIINKEIYRDYVVPAITRAINYDRDSRYNAMRSKRLSSLMQYSAGEAISNAVSYHDACSFANGLELIGKDVEQRVEASIPEIEARIKALTDQLKGTNDTLGEKSTEAEKKIAERSKLRLRSEIQVLQARLSTARQTSGSK